MILSEQLRRTSNAFDATVLTCMLDARLLCDVSKEQWNDFQQDLGFRKGDTGTNRHILLQGSLVIQMYGKCGALEDAFSWFSKKCQKDKFSWNFMITAYTQHGQTNDALFLFHQMQQEGMMPDKFIFASILSACISNENINHGRQVHIHIMYNECEDDGVVRNALLSMYSRYGKVVDARKVFDNMAERSVVSWTAMIGAYAQYGHDKEAFLLFTQMQRCGVAPSKITFVTILDVCALQAALNEGRYVHTHAICTDFESDLIVATALMNMYGKCGSLDDARLLFNKLAKHDMVSWTTMIAAYVLHGHGVDGLQLFDQMQLEGVTPDKFTFITILDAYVSQENLAEGRNMHTCITYRGFELDDVLAPALVNMYGKCGSLDDAQRVFDKFLDKTLIMWNALISAHAQHGRCQQALQFLDQMLEEGVIPDKVTYACILSTCSSQEAICKGKQLHVWVIHFDLEADVVVSTAVLNMYGKCGSLKDALSIFNKMPERNVISWNAMIAVFSQHGHCKESLQLFDKMQREGVLPDEVTFLILLSACSHAALVDESHLCLISMSLDHCIATTPVLFDCMIDLLTRAGRLDEAENLINMMPFQPTVVSWMTLLGACKNQNDVDRGERAATFVLELEPRNASSYILLSNIYALSRRDEVA